MAEDKKQNEKKYADYTDEEKADLMTAVVLGFFCVFASLLAFYVCFSTGKERSRVPGIILGLFGFMLLNEARREAGSLMSIIKGTLSDSPELTFESAQKEMEEFIRKRENRSEEAAHQEER